MVSWELVKQAEENFIKDRPIIAENNTILAVFNMLRAEIDEAEEAYRYSRVYEREGNTDEAEKWFDEAKDELSDIGIFLMALFRMMDVDMMTRIAENIGYNITRFPAHRLQEGDWTQIYPQLKQEVKKDDLKREFTGRTDGTPPKGDSI